MTSAYTQAADQLKVVLDACYADLGIVCEHDDIHESLGFQGVARLGVAPDERGDIVRGNNMLVQETWIEVKFFGAYRLDVDPNQAVDPRAITVLAERFRDALRNSNQVVTGDMWYYDLMQIRYPRDPTGNKTRFVATLRAFGNNAALVETTG
jgi:hypothetical protein